MDVTPEYHQLMQQVITELIAKTSQAVENLMPLALQRECGIRVTQGWDERRHAVTMDIGLDDSAGVGEVRWT